jgi:hypothetical protein
LLSEIWEEPPLKLRLMSSPASIYAPLSRVMLPEMKPVMLLLELDALRKPRSASMLARLNSSWPLASTSP